MKWAGMYLLGFVVLVGGLLLGVPGNWVSCNPIGGPWTSIGLAIVIGIGIMISVANSGRKENIEINRK